MRPRRQEKSISGNWGLAVRGKLHLSNNRIVAKRLIEPLCLDVLRSIAMKFPIAPSSLLALCQNCAERYSQPQLTAIATASTARCGDCHQGFLVGEQFGLLWQEPWKKTATLPEPSHHECGLCRRLTHPGRPTAGRLCEECGSGISYCDAID